MGNSEKKATEHILAYFDVLGYKQYVKDQNEEIFFKKIYDTVNRTFEEVKKYNSLMNELKINVNEIKLKVFSDNFLFSIKSKDDISNLFAVMMLVTLIAKIQLNLMSEYGFLLRGSVVKGNFYCDENFVYGSALVEAYELENNLAIYPRVILSNTCVDLICKNTASYSENFTEAIKILESSATSFNAINFLNICHQLQNEIVFQMRFGLECSGAVSILRTIIDKLRNPNEANKDVLKLDDSIIKGVQNLIPKLVGEVQKLSNNRNDILRYTIDNFVRSNMYLFEDGFWGVFFLNTGKHDFIYEMLNAVKPIAPHNIEQIINSSLTEKQRIEEKEVDKQHFLNCKVKIEQGLAEWNSSKVLAKYHWLANHFNESCLINKLATEQIKDKNIRFHGMQ